MGVKCGEQLISSLLYADDIVILAPDEHKLQTLIDIVGGGGGCSRWGMTLNVGKTKIVHLKLRAKAEPVKSFTFNGERIEHVEQYRYLGLLPTEHLEWNTALHEIFKKANRVLALLNH